MIIPQRPRRLRKNPLVRHLVAETKISRDMLIYPFFLTPGKSIHQPIHSLPGLSHYSVDTLCVEVEKCLRLGLNKFLLFGSGEEKFADARSAYQPNSLVSTAIRALKGQFGADLYLISDVCACAYTTHGHCGILVDGQVHNDLTLDILSKMALSHAEAGVDMVAPSDMMDFRIGFIRSALDAKGFEEVGIMAYSVKYASSYYGPFREAAGSSPDFGDRKSYQMDFRNSKEALREAALDESEGADILMVKPALAYLDIIKSVSMSTNLPLACYNVSGEYAMVKAAVSAGLVNEQGLVMENMTAFARAGADIIITYHAKDIVEKNWLKAY